MCVDVCVLCNNHGKPSPITFFGHVRVVVVCHCDSQLVVIHFPHQSCGGITNVISTLGTGGVVRLLGRCNDMLLTKHSQAGVVAVQRTCGPLTRRTLDSTHDMR